MNRRSDKQWLDNIRKAIIKQEDIKIFNNELDEEKAKLKKRFKKFTIEI